MQLYAPERSTLSPLLTLSDVGGVLGVSRATVYRLVEAGELEPIHIGARSPRFREEDVSAFVERRREAATS